MSTKWVKKSLNIEQSDFNCYDDAITPRRHTMKNRAFLEDLGRRIRTAREAAGVTQEELARHLGLNSRSSVSNIEKGRIDLTLSNMQRIAEYLHVSPLSLMGWDDGTDITEAEKAAIMSDSLPPEYYSLPEEQRTFVDKMIHTLSEGHSE